MTDSNTSAVRADLEPPKESRNSIVLNSVGNGMMLGSIPFLALQAVDIIYKDPSHAKFIRSPIVQGASIAAAVAGAVVGWMAGEREANRTEKHKEAIAKEVTQLRQDVEQLKRENATWQERTRDTASEPSATHSL